MMSDLARLSETPFRQGERAIQAWLKTIKASTDFDIGGRADKAKDGWQRPRKILTFVCNQGVMLLPLLINACHGLHRDDQIAS